MKARILILAIVALASLSASKNIDGICDGVPNISTRCRPTSLDISLDALFWTAQESGAENWAQVFTFGANETVDVRPVHFGWDPGFRIGIDIGMFYDHWDTQFTYTWFQTNGRDHASSSEAITSSFLGNFYIDNPLNLSGPTYLDASIRWTIHYNILDWELGRSYWVSPALALRPFVGLKGGWIHQSIHTHWESPTTYFYHTHPFSTAKENLRNHFGGVGPSAGLNSKWELAALCRHTFSLFGDFSGAIMWGHWSFGDVYRNDISQKVDIDVSKINGGASMFRAFMGLGWDVNWRQDYIFSLKVGYEAQFWLDQLQFYSFNVGRMVNLLTLQGGTLDVHFYF